MKTRHILISAVLAVAMFAGFPAGAANLVASDPAPSVTFSDIVYPGCPPVCIPAIVLSASKLVPGLSTFVMVEVDTGIKLLDYNASKSIGLLHDRFYFTMGTMMGIGTKTPTASVHAFGGSGASSNAMIKVEDQQGTNGSVQTLFNLINNGPPGFRFRDVHNNQTWQFRGAQNGAFKIDDPSTIGTEMEIQPGGNVFVSGSVTEGSSRSIKQDIEAIDTRSVLRKVSVLPMSEWSYKADGNKVRHVGPMAEDFHAAFGLGATNKGISSVDTGGVALAAIQGLNGVLQEKEAEVANLQERVKQLEAGQARLAALEEMLRKLAAEGEVALR